MKKIIAISVSLLALLGTSVLAEENITVNSKSSSSSSSIVSKTVKRIERNESREEIKKEKLETRQEKICDRISELAGKVGGKIEEKESALSLRQEERMAKWTRHIEEQSAKISQLRADHEANYDEHFKALEDKAQTDGQKKAVADFEAAVEAALTARRSAVDSAQKTFREGVKSAISGRKTDASQLMSDFNAARTAAFQKAESDCAEGVGAEAVKKNLRSDLQAAKTKLQGDRKNIEKVGSVVKELAAARRQAVEKAHVDFKAAMEKARAELKKAFPSEGN